MKPVLRLACADDRDAVIELVRQYHAFDDVPFDEARTASAIAPLLNHEDAGRIWLVEIGGATVGYIALCLGYSIEFGGRDAFVDEMYLIPEWRCKGVGKVVLREIVNRARELGARALHLEVARGNEHARRLYAASGFDSRERFHLMSRIL